MNLTGLETYRNVNAFASLDDANPHRLVTLMLDAVLARINEARGHIERGEIAAKIEKSGKALALVEGLQLSLDTARGGEIAANLERVYDYVARALLRANLETDASPLAEALGLLKEIKAGWEAIGASAVP
jgi:flagellar protein FliS